MWQKVIWLMVGGATGTLARVGLSMGVNALWPSTMRLGTFAANAAGCLLFGLVFAWLDSRVDGRPGLDHAAFVLLLAGFMGAFTTFSTFAFDTAELARDHGLAHAAGNLLLHNIVGVGMVLAGLAAGRWAFAASGA